MFVTRIRNCSYYCIFMLHTNKNPNNNLPLELQLDIDRMHVDVDHLIYIYTHTYTHLRRCWPPTRVPSQKKIRGASRCTHVTAVARLNLTQALTHRAAVIQPHRPSRPGKTACASATRALGTPCRRSAPRGTWCIGADPPSCRSPRSTRLPPS